MLRKVLVLSVCIAALSACSSKPKDGGEEVAPGITTQPLDGKFAGMDSDSGNVDGLSSINFPYDQSTLTPEAEATLQKNAEWMKANPGVTLQVEGHCDSRGSIEYNLTLGERRARTVQNHLVSLGINANRLTVLSYGEEKLLDSTDSEDAHSKNRRANFVPTSE